MVNRKGDMGNAMEVKTTLTGNRMSETKMKEG